MADKKSLEFDVWLLQSVILANIDGMGTPERILAAADLMSKTPMAEAELRAGLARLAQRGFIELRSESYAVTAMVPVAIKWSERDKIRQLLSAEPKPEDNKAADSGNLTKIAGDYAKRFQGFMSGLTKPKKE